MGKNGVVNMKTLILGLVGAFALTAATTASAQVTTYNTAPTGGFTYGTGNNYTPADATVLTNVATNSELAVRFHAYQQVAPASVAGLYSFALGTVLSYDFSLGGITAGSFPTEGANIFLTNLLTGQTVSYNPLCPSTGCLNDNTTNGGGDIQNSQRLTFSQFAGLGFNANTNNTYRIDLTAGGNTVTSFAQLGTGAGPGAVPEPATWAMMLIGFGAMGVSLRRRRRTSNLLQAA